MYAGFTSENSQSTPNDSRIVKRGWDGPERIMKLGTAIGIFSLTVLAARFPVQIRGLTEADRMLAVKHSNNFQVIEFRRYTIRDGERQHFAEYFDSYFPEAFQQLGALALGQFFERKNPNGFTWLRAFPTMDDHAKINAEFYYGAVWKEHQNTLNSLMTDSDNVLLLRPLSPQSQIIALPAVDPVTEPNGARGVVVAQIFAVKAGRSDEFARQAEATFANYRNSGIREAGILVTLDEKNNFPQLPIRTDGPYLVWLGIIEDDKKLIGTFNPLSERSSTLLFATGLLRAEPEVVVLDPTRRSRLRWMPEMRN